MSLDRFSEPSASEKQSGKPEAAVFPVMVARVCNVIYIQLAPEDPPMQLVVAGRLSTDQAFLLQESVYRAVKQLEGEQTIGKRHGEAPDIPWDLWSDEYLRLFDIMRDLGCDADAYFGGVADKYFDGIDPGFHWSSGGGFGGYAANIKRLRKCNPDLLPEELNQAADDIAAEVKRLYAPAAAARAQRIAEAAADVPFIARLLTLVDDLVEEFGPVDYEDAASLLCGLGIKEPADLDRFCLNPLRRRRLAEIVAGGGFNATLWGCPSCGMLVVDDPGPFGGVPRGTSEGRCPHCGAGVVLHRGQIPCPLVPYDD